LKYLSIIRTFFRTGVLELNKSMLLCISLFYSIPVFAYIDPGTGSLIVQSVIGAIAAIGVTVKIYWHKLKVFFSKKVLPASDSEQDSKEN